MTATTAVVTDKNREKMIKEFKEIYLKRLNELIDHCRLKEEVTFPSFNSKSEIP